VNERPSRWSQAATTGEGSLGELANATCALCGIELSIISLVPDGGPGSADVRWYCRDIVSCTERWTADGAWRAGRAPVPGRNAPEPDAQSVPDQQAAAPGDRASVPGDAQAPAGEPGPAGKSGPGGESGPADGPGLAEEPEPEPDKVRAGQSSGGGHQDMG
jgi:hypothetical protein